jgi:NDP-sugar pyrophosphorylase family protein
MSSALVLCGGLGSRLRPVVGDLPKALAPVDGVPFIDYLLQFLVDQNVHHVVLCTGFGAERVASHCGDGSRWGVRIDVSHEQEPLGTGGAVKHAERLIGSDPFFVLNGDSWVNASLAAMQEAHAERRASITIAVTAVPDLVRFGAVAFEVDGTITGFEEKGRTGPGSINAGIYLMSREVLGSIEPGQAASMEREVLPAYIGRGLYAIATPGPFIDIGVPESFAVAPQVLRFQQLHPGSSAVERNW